MRQEIINPEKEIPKEIVFQELEEITKNDPHELFIDKESLEPNDVLLIDHVFKIFSKNPQEVNDEELEKTKTEIENYRKKIDNYCEKHKEVCQKVSEYIGQEKGKCENVRLLPLITRYNLLALFTNKMISFYAQKRKLKGQF